MICFCCACLSLLMFWYGCMMGSLFAMSVAALLIIIIIYSLFVCVYTQKSGEAISSAKTS